MLNRRDFLKTAALGVAGLGLPLRALASRSEAGGRFGVHPFVESHPEAVFIMRTKVDHKLNSEAKKAAEAETKKAAEAETKSTPKTEATTPASSTS
jgi:hypothetical protein